MQRKHCWKRQKTISIPYGSIKRGRDLNRRARYAAFQFLMVRLKGATPAGGRCRAPSFQFLMVRLKAGDRGAATAGEYGDFNSLWFD